MVASREMQNVFGVWAERILLWNCMESLGYAHTGMEHWVNKKTEGHTLFDGVVALTTARRVPRARFTECTNDGSRVTGHGSRVMDEGWRNTGYVQEGDDV